MGLPAYYTEESSPIDMVQLPISWDPLSNPYPKTREEIKLQTGPGVTFEYELSTRRTPTFIFTIPGSLLSQFEAMYDAVIGSAFYFIPDIGVSPMDLLHVRITNPSFDHEPIGVLVYEGVAQQFFRWVIKMETEITALDIED